MSKIIMNDQSESNLSNLGEIDNSREELEKYYKPPIIPSRILKKEEAGQHLNTIGKTEAYNSYAYLKISVVNMNLTNIDVVAEFKYLQYIDVSGNNLKLENIQILSTMKYVLFIQADRNLLQSASLNEMPYLQVLKLNQNSIQSCEGIRQPLLFHLEVSHNQIDRINFDRTLDNLNTLNLSYNSISTLNGIDFKKLDSLYLAENQITSLSGVTNLVNLRILHLRSNPIDNLDHFHETMSKLTYLNLRSCKIQHKEELKKLEVLGSLEELIIKDCPVEIDMKENNTMLRTEIIAWIQTIRRIDKEVVNKEERSIAYDIKEKLLHSKEGKNNDE